MTLTYQKIMQEVWRKDEAMHNAVWQMVERLKNTLASARFRSGSIVSAKSVSIGIESYKLPFIRITFSGIAVGTYPVSRPQAA